MGPSHHIRNILACVASLSVLGQPLLAAAQSSAYRYRVPLTAPNQSITQGVLTATPASYDFGTLVLGSSAATSLTIKNTGQDAVVLTGFQLPAPYSQTNSCPATLVGGAACTVTVTYDPKTAGSYPATLQVQTDDPSSAASISLSGEAVVPTTNLSLSANSLDLGDAEVGASTATKSLTISNEGNSPATVNGIGVIGSSEFNQSNNCGETLAPGASCVVNVSSVPGGYGSRSGNLSIFEQASGTLYSVALAGFGNAAVMSVSPAALSLGSAVVNYGTTTAEVTVSNTGNRAIGGLSLASTSTDYTTSGTCGSTLAAASSCTATVTFLPTVAGARAANLTAYTTNAGAAAVALSGTGIAQAPAASADKTSLAFGNVPMDGSSAAQTVTYANTGNVPVSFGGVTFSTGSAHYAAGTTCGATLAVGASCTASVTFSPRAAGGLPGTLRAAFSTGNVDVSLTGSGTLGEATVNPTSVSFVDQQVASTSAAKTVTVTNSGNRKLTLSGVSIIAGATDFAQSNNCAEVAPAGSCTVNLTFTPTASGPLAGTLALVHDGVNGTTTVDLSGIGRTQAAAISTPAFASTPVGSSSTGTATLSNTGIGTLSLTAPAAGSVTGTGYSFVSTTCGPTVAVGASCATTVRFSPTTTAPASGTLAIATGAGTQTASFGSTGIQGFATVNPSSLSFAAQQVASTSAAKVVTVTNSGTDTLNFTGVGISAGGTDFAQSNNCGSVAVGASCTVNVAFTPSATGARAGTLSFTHNGGGIANVDLTGVGQAQSATLADVSFGGVNVGATPTLTSTLTNTGIGTLTVTPPAAGSVSSAQFSFVSTTCGSTLAAGASCLTTVRFAPTSGGAKTGTLALATGAGLHNAALTGTGNQAVLAFSYPGGNAVAWGSRQAGGTYGSSTATLTNSGNIAATGLAITPSSVWTLYGNTCTATLNAGASCTFNLNFSPVATQAYSGTVTASAATTSVINQLTTSGTGVAQAATLSTPSFGPTAVNASSTAVATLSNTGLGPLSVTVPTAAAVSGAAYSFVSTDCTSSLAVGSTCSMTVRFSPTSTTAANGTLSVATGAGQKDAVLGSTGIQGFASVSPSSLTYAAQQNGTTSAVQVVTVTNTGTNTLTFTGVGISTGATDFAQSNNCGSVAVNGTCTANVTFTPSAAGTRPGTLSFTHNGGGIANVSLTGTGQVASATLSNPSFATTSVGASNTANATLTNTGIGSISLTVPTAAALTGTDFSFVSTTCTTSLAPGAACTTTVRFSPTATTPRTGTLSVATGAGTQVASLAATAVQSSASLSAASLTFAAKQVGDSAPAQVVTVTNNGTTALVFTSIGVTSGATDFSQSSPACTTVAVGGTCTITVNFNPTAGNARTGTVTLAHNGTGATSISLTGTGQYQSAILSTPSFAPTAVGASNTGSSTLTNTGIGALSVTTPAAGAVTGSAYSFVSTTCGSSLPASGTCTTTVRFSPTSTAAASGMLSIDTGGGTKLATLGSTGIQGFASMSPSSLTFGAQQNSTTSPTQVVTVTNTGTNTLTFTGVGISAGASDFAQSNNCGAVAVNGTCTVNVTFTPSTAGSRPGTLTFTHNGGGLANVTLTGTGQAASATLSTPAFPATTVGSSSTATSTLTNTGIGSLSVTVPTAAVVTGTDFTFVSTTCGTSLAAGGTCSTTVRFSPTSTAARTGSVAIVTGAGTQSATLASTGVQGIASLSQSSIAFSPKQVGESVTAGNVVVTNTGTSTLTFTSVSVTAGATDFTQSSPACTALAVNATCTISVTFAPSTAGARSGTVTLVHNGTGSTSISLTGTGQAQSASLSTPAFPATAVGASNTAIATLTNTGVGTLSVTPPAAGSVTGAAYSFVSTTCPASLAAGGTCTATVRFSPTSTTAASGSLAIATGAGTRTVTLGSTGIQGYASVNPSSLTFATYGMWTTSPAQTVTVTNTGTNTLTFTGVGISTGTADFAQSNNCASVAVGGTCTVNVTFSPSTGGPRPGTLSFTHNGGGIANVALSGTGQGPTASLSMGAFPATAVGSSSTATATFTNTGIGPMPLGPPDASSVTGNAAFSFVSTNCPGMVPVGSSCASVVRFSPTTIAAVTGNFRIGDWNQWHDAALSATGQQAGVSLSAGSIAFPNETATRSSSTLSMTMTNSGNTTLTVSSLSLSAGAPDFTLISTNCVGSMGPGGTCTVTARFAPTTAGAKNGTIVFAHNGAGPTSFPLTGTSYAPAVITSRSFSPTTITLGGTSTFSWATSSASSVNVACSGAIGIIGGSTTALSGSITVQGTSNGTGTCTVNAYNVLSTGTSDSASMSVVAAPSVATASFSPSSVMAGNTTTFSWTTSNATSASVTCAAPASGSGSGLSGSITVSTSAAGTGSCTTTVYNAAGSSGSYQANLTVTPAYTYSWQASGYSTPAACGATTATRSVWCQRSDGATVTDGFCGGGKPGTTTATTDYSSCTYSFQYGSWSTPAGCGAVTQTRTASCLRSDGSTVSNTYCGTPVTTQGGTSTATCTYAFEYGAWSTPAGCGAVTQTRTAQCRRSDGAIVANGNCGTPVTSQGAADYSTCSYTANLGGWSACSNSCGTGTQSRAVSCTRSDGATVDNSSCGSPASSQSCSDNSGCAPVLGTFAKVSSACGSSYRTTGSTYTYTIRNSGAGAISSIQFSCPAGPVVPQNGSGPTTLAPGAQGTYTCMFVSSGTYGCGISMTGTNASNSGVSYYN
jgi:hypothetical protein